MISTRASSVRFPLDTVQDCSTMIAHMQVLSSISYFLNAEMNSDLNKNVEHWKGGEWIGREDKLKNQDCLDKCIPYISFLSIYSVYI